MKPKPTILLSTPLMPYPLQPWHDPATDISRQRFTHGNDIFTMEGHMHITGNWLIAENISAPTVILDHPTRENFEDEARKGYDYVGISSLTPNMDSVMEMARIVRRVSPGSQTILGCFAANAFSAYYAEEVQRELFDYVIRGEGVKFFRELCGDPLDAPITQRWLPKCGNALPWLDPHPGGQGAFVVSALGCGHGCDFCTTTAHFDNRRIPVSSPRQVVEDIKFLYRQNPNLQNVFLQEEDQDKEALDEIGQLLREELPHDQVELFVVISISTLAKWENLDDFAANHVTSLFIGMESKFASEQGYAKREGDPVKIVHGLHQRGIATFMGLVLGFDFHTRENLREDLEFYCHLEPTGTQITLLTPHPGTPLYERLEEEGRIADFKWEDVSFFGGGLVPKNFYFHELLNWIEWGQENLYQTWGPTVVRQLKLELQAYEYFRDHPDRRLREERSRLHRKKAIAIYPLIRACEQFAPNGRVRKQVKELEQRWLYHFGEPSTLQKVQSNYILAKATAAKAREYFDPRNRYIPTLPCKKYIYTREKANGDAPPYKLIYPNEGAEYHRYRRNLQTKGLQDRLFSVVGWAANQYDALRGLPFDPEKNKVAAGTKVI